MTFIRTLLMTVYAIFILLVAVTVTNGQQEDLTTVGLKGQLSGSTLNYVVNKSDDRAGGSDTVTMIYKVEKKAWLAIGFSDNGGKMVGSEAVVGLPSKDSVLKYTMSSIAASGVIPMPEEKQTLIESSIVQEGDVTTLQFTKILDEIDEIRIVIGPNTFLGAFGFDNSFFAHEGRDSFSVDLIDGVVEIVETRDQMLWKAHGFCAALAWGVVSPIAIGAAILKPLFPDGLWLKIHQSLNFLVATLTIAAFSLAVAAINKETTTGDNPRHFNFNTNYHSFIGLVLFSLVLFQTLSGQFRPNAPGKDEETPCIRSSWEILHRILGFSLLAVSWYQVVSGIQIYQTLFVDNTSNLSAIFWGIVGTILVVIALTFVGIKTKDNAEDENVDNEGDDSMKNPIQENNNHEDDP